MKSIFLPSIFSVIFTAFLAPSNVLAQVQFQQDEGNTNEQFIQNQNGNANDLDNTGVLNQTAVYNVGQSATYGFRGVWCPRPSFIVNGSTGGTTYGSNSSDSYNLSAALIVPIGGKVGKNCEEITTNLLESDQLNLDIEKFKWEVEQVKLEEYKFNYAMSVIEQCEALISRGVTVSPEQFPELAEKCAAVSISEDQASASDNVTTSGIESQSVSTENISTDSSPASQEPATAALVAPASANATQNGSSNSSESQN